MDRGRGGPASPAQNVAKSRSDTLSCTANPFRNARPGSRGRASRGRVDFERINGAALAVLPSLLARWLPCGRVEGGEFVALNPERPDRHAGSFRINLTSGRWADFAIEGARGGDVVSLAAYLGGIGQVEAAEKLAAMLGIEARYAR